jgi:hypothetical protein
MRSPFLLPDDGLLSGAVHKRLAVQDIAAIRLWLAIFKPIRVGGHRFRWATTMR